MKYCKWWGKGRQSVRLGFTGTQKGMTEKQKQSMFELIDNYAYFQIFCHGDCIGADKEAATYAMSIGMKLCCHPPSNPQKRAFLPADIIASSKPYLERNKDIVNHCSLLLAAPGEMEEKLRSGTWSTVRYAYVRKQTILVFPDGSNFARWKGR